jgi:hypothetical protein
MFCVAWADEEEESFEPRAELGIPFSAPLDLFDFRGQPLESAFEITVSRTPVFLEWYE